jgi:rsbT antagonist protein RsbS
MARVLNDIATMAGLMGTRTVVVGMSPTIAIILMDLGLQLTRVPTARNLEKGLELLRSIVETDDEHEDDEDDLDG